MTKKHWGITVLAVLAYIGAAVTLLGAILMIVGSAMVRPIMENVAPQYLSWASVGTIGVIMLGLVFLALAVLDYFIARGLWNGQNWARILTIIFAALGVLGSFYPFSIVNLAISALIIWYLGFYKPAVKYFK